MLAPSSYRVSLALFAALVGSACSSSPTAPARQALVALNAREYVAARVDPSSVVPQFEVSVVSRIRNIGTSPLYLARCSGAETPLYVVQLVSPADPDGSAYNSALACPLSEPLTLAANAERTDTLRLRAPSSVQGGRVLGALSGTMRLVFAASSCRNASPCQNATDAPLRSDEFTIALP